MEKNRENGRIRSPIWGLFYKKHKKNSLFLKKNAQKLASFENYTYICNMKNLLAGDIHRQQELSGDKKPRHLKTTLIPQHYSLTLFISA